MSGGQYERGTNKATSVLGHTTIFLGQNAPLFIKTIGVLLPSMATIGLFVMFEN